jgi:hypothetical protein
MKIAVCFFGITRSLTHTIGSIESNILTPARAHGDLRVFCHFYNQSHIASPRTGEHGVLDPEEYQLLRPDEVRLEQPDVYLNSDIAIDIRKFGDHYQNNFHSLNNLILQLLSLRNSWELAAPWTPDICIFARPDLYYHDDFSRYISRPGGAEIQLANWGNSFGGVRNDHLLFGRNDRFSICHEPRAMNAYGSRIEKARAYCSEYGHGLHSESFLRYALERDRIQVSFIPLRASRVRFGGKVHEENFRADRFSKFLHGRKRIIIKRTRSFLVSLIPEQLRIWRRK